MLQKMGQIRKSHDDQFIMINDNGHQYKVNQTCAYVWKLIDGKKSISEVVQCVSDVAQIEPEEASSVVQYIIKELKQIQLLKESNSEVEPT
jgi:hypothetical protein